MKLEVQLQAAYRLVMSDSEPSQMLMPARSNDTRDNLRRSLSLSSSNRASTNRKSGLDDVAYLTNILDRAANLTPSPAKKSIFHPKKESVTSISYDHGKINSPGYDSSRRRQSGDSIYASIRNSNPFSRDSSARSRSIQLKDVTDNLRPSSGDQQNSPSRPPPFDVEAERAKWRAKEQSLGQEKKSYRGARVPSYEGNGYLDEISLSNLHARFRDSVDSTNNDRLTSASTRMSNPIHPALRKVSSAQADMVEKYGDWPPKPVPWPGNSPKLTAHDEDLYDTEVAWSGYEPNDGFVLPPTSNEAQNTSLPHAQVSSGRSQPRMQGNAHDLMRIVSKENIRAALGGISQESLLEDQVSYTPSALRVKRPTTAGTHHQMNTTSKLQPYNTHLFPRKATKVSPLAPVNSERGEIGEIGESYEMEQLRNGK